MSRDEWQQYANCGESTDHILPPGQADEETVEYLCNRCRVRPECAQWAVDGSEGGVWVCGTWIPGDDEDKRGGRAARQNLLKSIPEERERRGTDV